MPSRVEFEADLEPFPLLQFGTSGSYILKDSLSRSILSVTVACSSLLRLSKSSIVLY